MPYIYITTCQCGTAQDAHPVEGCPEYRFNTNRIVWVDEPGQTSSPRDDYVGGGVRGPNTGD